MANDNDIMPRRVKFLSMQVFTAEGGFVKDNPDGWTCNEQ